MIWPIAAGLVMFGLAALKEGEKKRPTYDDGVKAGKKQAADEAKKEQDRQAEILKAAKQLNRNNRRSHSNRDDDEDGGGNFQWLFPRPQAAENGTSPPQQKEEKK